MPQAANKTKAEAAGGQAGSGGKGGGGGKGVTKEVEAPEQVSGDG